MGWSYHLWDYDWTPKSKSRQGRMIGQPGWALVCWYPTVPAGGWLSAPQVVQGHAGLSPEQRGPPEKWYSWKGGHPVHVTQCIFLGEPGAKPFIELLLGQGCYIAELLPHWFIETQPLTQEFEGGKSTTKQNKKWRRKTTRHHLYDRIAQIQKTENTKYPKGG